MTNTIKVRRKDFIDQLASIKHDNIGIADVVINRQRLIQALKLQTQPQDDVLTIAYGKLAWQADGSAGSNNLAPEPCISFSYNHTVMRFLNRPKQVKYGEPKIKHLNFIDHTEPKPELTGIPLDTQALLKALSFVLPCVATEQSRPVLNCVLLECGDDIIKLVAADGYRLGVATIPANGIPQVKILIYPAELLTFLKSIKPIGKGKSKYYPEIYINIDNNKVTFTEVNFNINLEDSKVTYHATNNNLEVDKQAYTFPDYTQLIPKDGTHIQLIASDILEAVKALNAIAKDGSGIIRLKFSKYPDKLTLSARSEELGDSSVECPAMVDKPCKIAANSKYLIDLLKLCGDSAIDLFINHYTNPMVCHNGIDQLQVIMPMFVQWGDK